MHYKRKLVTSINNSISFGRRSTGYIKLPLVAAAQALPISLKQRIKQCRIYKYVLTSILATGRSPRVYVKRNISLTEFFHTLNQRKIEYVLLRWWQDLPDIPPGEDMDILIRDEHRVLISDLVTFHDNGSNLMCDIYTISGVNNGCRRNIPYFQATLAHTLLNTRVTYKCAYVPSPIPYFASLAYHALFHKGYGSGLHGFGREVPGVEHDYTSILEALAEEQGIDVEVTVQGLYEWLKKEGFAPADDTLTKLVEHKPELSVLETPLASDARGGELLVFIARERLIEDGLMDDFKSFLETENNLDVIDIKYLNNEEKSASTLQIRGGKWDKGPFRYSGGKPGAFIIAYDYHPRPLSPEEQKSQTRMTNRNTMYAKYRFRDRLKSLFLLKGDYNGVHSADNEHDAWNYISILGEDYRKQIHNQVECRRVRYSRKWGIKKLLSANPHSKTEVIQYNRSLAVKKTFRVGQEALFEAELFAVKELSKEFEFIPPLIEEGDGFYIIPYLENILMDPKDQKTKKALASRKYEIVEALQKIYVRGLSYSEFTPSNVVITPDNKLYCLGLKLQYSDTTTARKKSEYRNVEESMVDPSNEIRTFFNKAWAPLLGKLGKAPFITVQASK